MLKLNLQEDSMDITKLPISELKALAYDEARKLSIGQRNMQAIEQEIAKREQDNPPKEESCES